MKRRELIKCAALMVGGASATRLGWALTTDPGATLPEQFKTPPPSARPGVFWFWMGGMISREGITQDTEALAAQGVGRVLLMQMPEQCPYPRQWSYRDYPGKVKVLSDEWFDLVNFAVGECDRLGLQMASFTCPGWGHVGGPWVPPTKGTKKLAVTTVEVAGPSRFDRTLPKPPPSPVASGGNQIPPWNDASRLLPRARENFFRDEAVLAVPDLGQGVPVPLNRVVNLGDRLDAHGRLSWEVPEGRWTIYRICLVSENGINHPAPPEAMGLEVDRMDPDAVRLVFDGMIGRILREARAKGYESFKAFETDSYETGFQDFGLDFREEFKRRRGYDSTLWLPAWQHQHMEIPDRELVRVDAHALDARPAVIESASLTARFREDMLRTISDLWAERFQGTLRQLADENGLEWMTEPYFKIPLDWTTVGGRSTMPGAEFWVGEGGAFGQTLGNAPEIAALHGRPIAWAEAFTAESYHSAWSNDPWTLKRSGDAAFARGINLFYMHGFVHNPFSDEHQPGLTMGYWGTQLSRHVTWWSLSRPWHEYLARSQHLLQQGKPVFHALRYPAGFEPDPKMSDGPYRTVRLPDEVLMNGLSVRDGKLVLPHGAEFAALHLTGGALRPEALSTIRSLVGAGAVVIGDPPPRWSPSLEGYPECDAQAARLIDEIWGAQGDGKARVDRSVGRGRVISGVSLEEGMRQIGRLPDFTYEPSPGAPRPDLRSFQRIAHGARYWFVCNHGCGQARVHASFEVSGLQPEWWDPVDGSWRDLPEFRFERGRTIIPLRFDPLQSGFVVFRRAAEGDSRKTELNFPQVKAVMALSGPWKASFDPRWGGSRDPVTLARLEDWSKSADPGIRHYSGTAIYNKTFDLSSPALHLPGSVFLDLGTVHNLARVRLNGRDLGTVWCAPWRVRVPAELLKERGNELAITVANTWVNRLIGDELEPEDFETEPGNQTGTRLGSYHKEVTTRGLKDLPDWLINGEPRPSSGRYTFSSWFFFDKTAPLQPAGLLGPVRLMTAE